MKRIASFSVNHDVLKKGMYISRIDGDVVTYDVRMKLPNKGDYLPIAAMHTIEHLFATYARNTKYESSIIYVGPMGCRTGFYFLVRDDISHAQALEIVRESMRFIADYEGDIPGVSSRECGNYREHDLPAAKAAARDMLGVLENWSEEKMTYER